MKYVYLVVIIFIVFAGCKLDSSYSMSDVLQDYDVELPLDDPREVLEFLKDNGEIDFVYPSNFIKYHYKGELVHFKDSKNINLEVTPRS